MTSASTKKVVGATRQKSNGGTTWWELLACGHRGDLVRDFRGTVVQKQAKTRVCRACAQKERIMDVEITGHGTIFLAHLKTEAARTWVNEHVAEPESWQWMGDALVVDQHHVRDLVVGMLEAGLVVE